MRLFGVAVHRLDEVQRLRFDGGLEPRVQRDRPGGQFLLNHVPGDVLALGDVGGQFLAPGLGFLDADVRVVLAADPFLGFLSHHFRRFGHRQRGPVLVDVAHAERQVRVATQNTLPYILIQFAFFDFPAVFEQVFEYVRCRFQRFALFRRAHLSILQRLGSQGTITEM